MANDIFDDMIEALFMLPVVAVKSIFNFFENTREEKRLLRIGKIEDMNNLHWREFERFIMLVLKQNQFSAELGEGFRDGGVDIHAHKNGQKYLVQCKKWQKYKVSEPNMREFLGAMCDFDTGAEGIYVTTSDLTRDARLFAERNNIIVWDKTFLEGYFSENTESNSIEDFIPAENYPDFNKTCSRCSGRMVARVAKRGEHKGEKFFGCSNFPKCRSIER